jgi:hypothetical protein
MVQRVVPDHGDAGVGRKGSRSREASDHQGSSNPENSKHFTSPGADISPER